MLTTLIDYLCHQLAFSFFPLLHPRHFRSSSAFRLALFSSICFNVPFPIRHKSLDRRQLMLQLALFIMIFFNGHFRFFNASNKGYVLPAFCFQLSLVLRDTVGATSSTAFSSPFSVRSTIVDIVRSPSKGCTCPRD